MSRLSTRSHKDSCYERGSPGTNEGPLFYRYVGSIVDSKTVVVVLTGQ